MSTNPDRVMFVTFAPGHFSATRRIEDAMSERFVVEPLVVRGDKVAETIGQRLLSGRYLRLFTAILGTRARAVWVWGHDAGFVASLAALLRPDVRLIWDISDVNQHLLSPGLKGRLLRALERVLILRAQRLLLTSSQFYDRYYARFVDRSRVRVVENRRSPRQQTVARAAPQAGPLRIVFAGIFRSPEVLRTIGEVARRMDGVEFRLHGYPNRIIPEGLVEQLASLPNVHLHGRYDATNIGALYEQAHFVWGFVDPDENDNERWLLSNRLYDAIVTQRPVLTNSGTASGDYALAHQLGLVVPMEAGAIAAALAPYLDPGGTAYRGLAGAMPEPATGYMSGEYARVIAEVLDE